MNATTSRTRTISVRGVALCSIVSCLCVMLAIVGVR
jgi:hypothetical protein